MFRSLAVGAAAGLAASVVVAPLDRYLGKFVSDKQRRREKMVREDSPHHIAGEVFGSRLLGRELSAQEKRIAQALFVTAYGIGWGLVYRGARQAFPQVSKYGGLPFSVGFYLACDGAMAPLLQLTPSVHRIPWQLNTKEALNHAAWTTTAEAINRLADRRLSA